MQAKMNELAKKIDYAKEAQENLQGYQDELAKTDALLLSANQELENLQKQVEEHKQALKATPEELTLLTRTRMKRDSIRTQFETLGAKIRYIRQKMKE